MKRLLPLGLLIALLSASGGGAATTPFPGSASWADSRHGWAPNVAGLCERTTDALGESSLCSTEDGGRTWRMNFVGGNYIFVAARTSEQAGIVSSGAYGHYEFWTRDNGKHWYRAALPGVDVSSSSQPWFAGRGKHLYFARGLGDTVSQLTPWPPPGPAECAGQWSRSIVDEDADAAGNVCLGPPVDAGMRSVPIVTVAGELVRLTRVPEGFFALFRHTDDTELTAAVRHAGMNVIRELPAPGLPAGTRGTVLRHVIDWPSISVVGLYWTDPDAKASREVVWRSTDGGATWSVRGGPGWSRGQWNPIARSGAAAGAVGDEIVLAGGRVGFFRAGPGADRRASRVVQAYRPSRDSWRRLPDLPAAVTRAAGASTGDELYVVGGFDRAGRPQRDAFVLRAGRWHRLPSAPAARAAAGAAIVAGKLYVVGGIGPGGLARRTLVLDLRSDRWSAAPGPRPRAYLGVAAARGRIVALGGRTSGPETSMALAESWRPGERRWRRLPSLSSRRTDAAAVVHGGRIIVLGGAATEHYQPLASTAALDPSGGRWEPLPDLPTPRHGIAAAVVSGKLYALVGGDDYVPDDLSVANESLLLRP